MSEEKIARSYAELHKEMRFRTDAIRDILTGKVSARSRIAEEYCYLQFRLICELIALGCLVVHQEITPSKSIEKAYKADWIMKELGKLHAKFYPSPVEPKDTETPLPAFIPITSDYLTQDELHRLYTQEAAGRMHRGNLRDVMKLKSPNFVEIRKWHHKTVRLLNRHTITSRDESRLFLFGVGEDGETTFNVFKNIGRY